MSNDVESEKYNREFLIKKLKEQLDIKRFEHCLRVEIKSEELAKRFNIDINRSKIAGLLHDYCKQMPDQIFFDTVEKYNLNSDLLNYGNAIWHGIIGASIISDQLDIHDELILNAIKKHTVADSYMNGIDKVVFVADFIEDGRNFPEVDTARKLAESSLDDAVNFEIKHTLEYLIKNNKKIYPKMLESYNHRIFEEI